MGGFFLGAPNGEAREAARSLSAALFFSALASISLIGCQNGAANGPVVLGIDAQRTGAGTADASGGTRSLQTFKEASGVLRQTAPVEPAISARVTFAKASLFGRDFLYGSDLQYSTIGDQGFSLVLQSLAMAHLVVRFRLVDDRLQMVATTNHLVESDINAPERLVQEFPVVAQDASTLTVSFRSASPILTTVVSGAKAPPARSTWVRSVKFESVGNYVMFETSVEQADGSIAEFMESFFPREGLIAADAQPLFDDEDIEPLADRFRFLGGDDVWLPVPGKGRVKTKLASRFGWKPGQIIEWFVTPNVPSQYLPMIKAGVEGWNRYSRSFWGVDIVAFKGLLPDGVKIGDPRYNVINWDSVQKAGAAYESQATDPLTGIQSHSLIYLPNAWINIGKKFWELGSASEPDEIATASMMAAIQKGSFLGRPLPIRCMREAMASVSLRARVSPDEFSRELLRGTLFHEMGHALGLAHNFKGSLSMDPANASSPFSSSIMDYNQYELERSAFDAPESASGPLLEYDRQIISALYGGGKELTSSDLTMPACDDSEADDHTRGVDPLCVRYDAGKDPTVQTSAVIQLLRDESAAVRGQRSLPSAIQSLVSELPAAATINDEAAARAVIVRMVTSASGLTTYYYAGGAQALSYMARASVRSLRTFNSVLPEDYDEAGMRERALNSLLYVSGLDALEAPVHTAFEALQASTLNWLSSTPFANSLPDDLRVDKLAMMVKPLITVRAALTALLLPKVRTSVWAELARTPTAPFYLSPHAGPNADFEEVAVETLEKAVSMTSLGKARPLAERTAAAKALLTFADSTSGTGAIDRAKSRITDEIARARTASDREVARSALRALASRPMTATSN